MKLTCFLTEDARSLEIRPASPRRDWIDATPQRFAARCLPLLAANSHGWEILLQDGCSVEWSGGEMAEDLKVTTDSGGPSHALSHFGFGILTFRVHGLFRTEPGINLWVGGPVNLFRDGIQPLSGLVETDWSPMPFTMNWKVTRPMHPIRFEKGDPICHIFPVPRGTVDETEPELRSLASDPQLKRDYEEARDARRAFIDGLRANDPQTVQQGWQRNYFKGGFPSGRAPVAGHQTAIEARPFVRKD
ncbi:DUF6065 family protein [Aestuariivirga sp.]|uniref:DUF6065 family protein n=1 Tax=Aestuariivirga sp. TaxID=2650926 RepID=UPI00391C3D67